MIVRAHPAHKNAPISLGVENLPDAFDRCPIVQIDPVELVTQCRSPFVGRFIVGTAYPVTAFGRLDVGQRQISHQLPATSRAHGGEDRLRLVAQTCRRRLHLRFGLRQTSRRV